MGVVEKTPNAGFREENFQREIAATLLAQSLNETRLQVVPYVSHSTNPFMLRTGFVPASRREWVMQDFVNAAETLRQTGNVLTAHVGLLNPTYAVTFHENDNAAFRKGVTSLPGSEVLRGLVNELQQRSVSRVAHCDTRPENWVLTVDGPVLLDFGGVAFAPEGWDVALTIAHANTSLSLKTAAATRLRVDWVLVQQIAAYFAGLTNATLMLSTSETQLFWARHYQPVFLQLVFSEE
jgi:thiamine kinase-like enzyme